MPNTMSLLKFSEQENEYNCQSCGRKIYPAQMEMGHYPFSNEKDGKKIISVKQREREKSEKMCRLFIKELDKAI